MKYLITVLALTSALLANTQLQAHDSFWKNAGGANVKNGGGDCWFYGKPDGTEPCDPEMAMAPAPAAAPAPAMAKAPAMEPAAPAAMTDEPVIKEVINLKGVTFKTGSDVINTSSNIRLNISVKYLNRNPDLNVIVAGHTDNVGNPARNRELSQKRAVAVKAYLEGRGVDSSRLTARGFGDSEPAASNDTAGGRAKNRRVELRIH